MTDTQASSSLLLSSKRSTLIITDGPAEHGDASTVAANRTLLISAAARLGVPCVSPERFSPANALAQGRDQLVIAQPGPSDFADMTGKSLQRFVVIDCLQEGQRPSLDALDSQGMTVVTTEMVVFEWLERADSDDFRALLKQIR